MEPVFDERVTWEGQSNKRIQAYTLCLLNYDFFILRKAFLVHRPGIKVQTGRNKTTVKKMDQDIGKIIAPELRLIYGARNGCRV
ncbi:unnamed protein product [Allacma fusca]|uniref:Uncharacterized protein n=1 Tax=Allacma fusca TaxID=39272 RepID=A0A8J2JKI6_9HEXA|nr:unnamed protein product [Allacma fusca]